MLLLVLWSCAAHNPPVVYSAPLPEIEAPMAASFSPAKDECTKTVPFSPNYTAPYVVDGYPTCRAQLVPESKLIRMINDADAADFWSATTDACYEARSADRLHGQNIVDMTYAQGQVYRRESNALRVAVPAVFIGGVATGLVIGVASALSADSVSP